MNYQYTGKRSAGRTENGKIEAETKREALQKLENRGLIVTELKETKPWNKDIVLNKQVKNKEFIIFLRQYATLIHAGIPISDATKTMMQQTGNYLLRTSLDDIDKQLDKGEALSDAASGHPKVFPPLLVNMIRAGEASGRLDEILNDMADYYEKTYRNKQRIISALLYPTVVGVITIFMSIFLLVFIVPQFVSMFRSMGEELPAYTQFILELSGWMGSWWWVLLLFAASVFLAIRYMKQFERFVYQFDRLAMKFPLLGALVHKGALARMTQTLSTLVSSSVPILQSLEITKNVVGNKVLQQALEEAEESLIQGESLAEPMKGNWAFPPLIVQMIQVGEKTGTLDQMLARTASFYEEEVEQLSSRIKTMIEPLMIIILTVMVGSIIAAVVIPMFGMFDNMQ
ncbi:type II secretion system F family protein [Virgibacillus xinjiangensis]|uniref:Type II secretion system F family protein n=1 Tax=Virgibacillus xinjiangensis TaxID=393090 RepID=A0ABV7CUG1_9BACI